MYFFANSIDNTLHEISSKKKGAKTLQIKLLDTETLIKKNELKEVTNPVFFERSNVPTTDGLLSNEIFGIVKADRANIFAYINLVEDFLHPLVYKVWSGMDSKVRDIVHGAKTFKIDSKGQFVEDPNGKTGLKFLKDNIDKVKFVQTESQMRKRNITFLKENKDKLFVKKWIVIPAFYRDVNTSETYKGVGEINKYYASLLMGAKSLRETKDYGFDTSDIVKGRIQETLLNIYDFLGKEPNIYGKKGIIRRSILGKTSDYGARLLITAPELRVEHYQDLESDLDHTVVPLHACCVTFLPYVIFNVRRFFENEFMGRQTYEMQDGTEVELNDPLIYFSDERIKAELDRYRKGFSNRFVPIKVPIIVDGKEKFTTMRFKGRLYKGKFDSNEETGIINRDLTWCDVFFRAAVEASQDKHILITRFPIDTYYNIFPTKVRVASTKETEPIIINDKVYNRYPKIRQEDIGSNTSNLFVDSLQMTNLYLEGIGGDYDGDQVQIRGVYTVEANEECDRYLNSKTNFVNLKASNIRIQGKETIQAMYCLTKVDRNTKLVNPVF